MGVWLGPRGRYEIAVDDISYSEENAVLFAADLDHWEMAILSGTNATLTFLEDPGPVQICVIGAGKNGSSGKKRAEGYGDGGDGGDGGRMFTTFLDLEKGSYQVSIGTEGAETTITGPNVSVSSASGTKKDGGSGGYYTQSPSSSHLGYPGEDGFFAYGEESDTIIITALADRKFGGSGAGGHANSNSTKAAKGGESGAGDGGIATDKNGKNGTANSGGGGGGGYGQAYGNSSNGTGGAGGSGLLLIRSVDEMPEQE